MKWRFVPSTWLRTTMMRNTDDAPSVLRCWSELIPDAPRQATLTASAGRDAEGRPIRRVGPAADAEELAGARRHAAVVEPFTSGVYINALSDEGATGVNRAYRTGPLRRLTEPKRRYDPDNLFHLNHKHPAAEPSATARASAGPT